MQPDVVSYNAILASCGSQWQLAVELLKKMTRNEAWISRSRSDVLTFFCDHNKKNTPLDSGYQNKMEKNMKTSTITQLAWTGEKHAWTIFYAWVKLW